MKKNPPIIKQVVKAMGGTIEEIVPERGYFYIKIKGRKIFVSRKFKISENVFIGGETTKFKDLTYALLKKNNLPTPKTICIYKYDKQSVQKKLKTLKYPIIIKDAQGSNSKGIFPNIQNIKTAEKIIQDEIKKFPRLIAQEMVFGKEFRILVLDGKVIAALELIPPRIFGDGQSTVQKLMEEKQLHTEKKTPLTPLFKEYLREQGFSLQSVPKKGAVVYLKKNSSLAEGGETRDMTAAVSPGIEKICAKACRVTEKCLAGIDVLCEDLAKNPARQHFSIIEINGKPDVYIHYNPTYGKTQNVIKLIINYILKNTPA